MPTATTAAITKEDSSTTDERAEFIQQFDQPAQPVTQTAASVAPTAAPSEELAASKRLHPLPPAEVVIGVSAICLWLCFFLAGIVVETKSLRELVSAGLISSFWELVSVSFILMTCYTVTNLAILSSFAAVIGKFCRRALTYETGTFSGFTPAPTATIGTVMVFYSVAIARGFVIFLMMTGGLILLQTDAVTASTTEEYIKMAGTISILAFMAGYDAEIFKRALDRISAFSTERNEEKSKTS